MNRQVEMERNREQYAEVIIVGAGFGGIELAKQLCEKSLNVLLIDRTNHHLFQPLLYQVATAALSPADIAVPIRSIFWKCGNIHVLLDEVLEIVPKEEKIRCKRTGEWEYKFLVLAPGVVPAYFGKEEWRSVAPGLKTLSDALEIRRRILRAYEEADKCTDAVERRAWTTFVVIGGGPTGVEIAGALAEIGKHTMTRDFPNLSPDEVRILLIEAADRILPTFPPQLSLYATHALEKLGVEVRTSCRVTDVTETAIVLNTGERIPSRTVIWAAGNRAPDFLKTLGVPRDQSGRVIVEQDCSVPGYPNIFVIGDAACFRDPRWGELPGIAPVALQQARFVARILLHNPEKRPKFRYRHKGMLATIGRALAVGELPFKLRVRGFLAWLLWAVVHILSLIRFRNRLAVMLEWLWYYITFQPGARLIIEYSPPPDPPNPKS